MICNQKDIVLVSVPFSDRKKLKVRPAIVISKSEYNRKTQDCILVPMTSVIKNVPYSILISQKDLTEGKLIKNSRIRVDKIFNIDKDLIAHKIGVLDNNTFELIKKEFNSIM